MTNILVKKKGRRPRNKEAFDKIDELKQGEFMILLKGDWNLKTLPGAHIIRRYTNREFKVETLMDETGWRITAL